MASRLELQAMLEKLLGSRNVYYQPPLSVKMNYPAIVYSRANFENNFANDNVYKQTNVYKLIVIDQNPDSDVVKKVSKLQYCSYNKNYSSQGLNHDVFILNY